MTEPTTKRRSAEEMFPLIEQYLSRPEKQDDFCRAHDLPKAVFAYWLRRYRSSQAKEEEGFVELLSSSDTSSSFPGLEVEYPNGVKIRIHRDISLDDLQSLIELVR